MPYLFTWMKEMYACTKSLHTFTLDAYFIEVSHLNIYPKTNHNLLVTT